MQNSNENSQQVKFQHSRISGSPRRRFRYVFIITLIAVSTTVVYHLQSYNNDLASRNVISESLGNQIFPTFDDGIEARDFVQPYFWFMPNGNETPAPAEIDPETGHHKALLWPGESNGDRIVSQLMFVPPSNNSKPKDVVSILLYRYYLHFHLKPGRSFFIESKCPVNTCSLTFDERDAPNADAIVHENKFMETKHIRPPGQIWVMILTESPYHTPEPTAKNVINWTATYRRDSDLVFPYGKWVYYDPSVRQIQKSDYNFAANRTKKVLWVVSNCNAQNNRLEIAKKLGKYIQVDIYGKCGDKKCPTKKCLRTLAKDYKFYLAFENSNCRDYITEKFFSNALKWNMLPIVMGAHPEDYVRVAPHHSFIHVEDFPSLKVLASYLHLLDSNDNLYNAYFEWQGTGEFVKNHFFCRLCAILHDDYPSKTYKDVHEWWNKTGTCTKTQWYDTYPYNSFPTY